MHRLSLITIGKIKTSWIEEGCSLYSERLKSQCQFKETILSVGSKEEENGRIAKALEKAEGTIVVLDDKGKEFSSEEFSSWTQKRRDIGDALTFVIGGAYGLDDFVRSRANLVLSLSRMTLPHELCKLLFLEQLFRVHSILQGSGYHH